MDRADKLVYMYCNEKILGHMESNEYIEDMPIWMYDCDDMEDDHFDVGPMLCTSLQVEENLEIDSEELSQACDRVINNDIILEGEEIIDEDETL